MHQNLIEYTIQFSAGTKFIAKSLGSHAGPAAGAAIGLAFGASELHNGINSYRSPKFEVEFELNGKHVTKEIRAKSGLDAVTKLKSKYPTGSGFKYYRL